MQVTLDLQGFNFGLGDFRNIFRKISLVDGFDIGPIILDSDLFELCLVLVVPGPQTSSLLFGESTSTGHRVLTTVSHLDVHRDKSLVCNFGVSLNQEEVLLVFAGHSGGEVAAFKLSLAEP